MKRTARLAACAAVTLALTGVGAAAQAGTGHPQGHVRHHTRVEHDGNTHVLRALGRLDRQLAHATRSHRLAPLTDADRAALQTNAASDEATVEAVATAYAYQPTQQSLTDARQVLQTFHPARYVVATDILRRAEVTAAAVVALQAGATPGSTAETDLAAAASLLAGVDASDFSATVDRATIRAARNAVAQAQALVGVVRADLVAASSTTA